MATRIFFQPDLSGHNLFLENLIEFEWVPGLAKSQSLKCIRNLHQAIEIKMGLAPVLEISTKSNEILGIALSAFNLLTEHEGQNISVESLYQASKVFEQGGPFADLITMNAIDSKRDPRLKSHGFISGYRFLNSDWPIKSSPNFYDYLYISALLKMPERTKLSSYKGFTDIAYSQNSLKLTRSRSFNCQARSASIYVSLLNQVEESQILDFLYSKCKEQVSKIEKYSQEFLP